MYLEAYDKFTEYDKGKFAKVVNTLLTKTFVLEKKFNSKLNKTVINDDYRFIEYNSPLVKEYLKFIGWELVEDYIHGVYMIQNSEFNNYVRFDKTTTVFLLVLRLIYEEKQETVSTSRETIIKLSEILNKVEVFKLLNKVPQIKIKNAITKLIVHEIIDNVRGDYDLPDSLFIINPSIIHCITDNNLKGMLKSYTEIKQNDESGNEEELIESEDLLEDNLNEID